MPGHYLSQMELKLGSLCSTDVMVHQLAPEYMCSKSAPCLCATRARGEEEQGRLENLCHIFFLCTLQRLGSVLNLDLGKKEGRFGKMSDVLQIGIRMCSGPLFF